MPSCATPGCCISRQGSGSIVRLPSGRLHASSLIVTPDDADTIAMTFSAPLGAARARSGIRGRRRQAARPAGDDWLPARRLACPARDPRPALHRRWPADRSGPDRRDQRRAGRHLAARPRPARTRVSGSSSRAPAGRTRHESFSSQRWPAHVHAGRRHAVGVRRPSAKHARRRAARAAYIIPDFHNPTGAVMSDAERGAWAHELRRHDIVPIVDESLRGSQPRRQSSCRRLRHVRPAHSLIVDSTSKSYWGGLRIGWTRVPLDR